jgi:hypothetical protein
MTNPKHTIPVSEVRPGDSIRIGGHVRFVTSAAPWHDWIEQIVLTCAPMVGLRRTFWVDLGTALPVGYTNRNAKRARGKLARRQRFADRGAAIGEANRREDAKRYAAGEVHRLQMKGGGERLAALVRDIIDGSEGEPMPDTIALPDTPAGRAAADAIAALNDRHRAYVDAQSAAIASSISPAEDAAVIRHTRIAGRSPGPIPRPGQAARDGTARIESVTFTADTQHGLTSVVTKTRPIMSHDEIDAASIVGQRVAISCGYGSPSPARDGLSLPMSATLSAAEEPALITRNVPGFAWVPGSLGPVDR